MVTFLCSATKLHSTWPFEEPASALQEISFVPNRTSQRCHFVQTPFVANNIILKLAENLGHKTRRSSSASWASGWCLSLPWFQVERKWQHKKVCKLKKKYLSRKDGLLVRSARESIAKEVRLNRDENQIRRKYPKNLQLTLIPHLTCPLLVSCRYSNGPHIYLCLDVSL